jgi:hypothetical protein
MSCRFFLEYLPWAGAAVALFIVVLWVCWPESDDESGLPFHPPWDRK